MLAFDQNYQYLSLNLGTGFGTSVLQLIKVFERVNNVNIPYSFRGRREGDIAITIADNSLMKKVLNWQPTRSIEEMCKDGWLWQCKNPHGFKILK